MADDKPFVCCQPGCGMKFANEDHLSVHEAKHEMSLALTSGATRAGCLLTFVADQTPTPTKFLRNCEEMGLFHELSKNPFEEAFKKATDDKNVDLTESSALASPVDNETTSSLQTDCIDALNTPTLMRQIATSCTVKSVDGGLKLSAVPSTDKHVKCVPLPGPNQDTGSTINCSTDTCVECTSLVKTSLVDTDTHCSLVNNMPHDSTTTSDCSSNTVYLQVMLTSPTGDVIPVHVPATVLPGNSRQFHTSSVTMATTSTGVTMTTKQRLKAAIQQNIQAGLLHSNMQVMSDAVDWVTANEQTEHLNQYSVNQATAAGQPALKPVLAAAGRPALIQSIVRTVADSSDRLVRTSELVQLEDADTSTPKRTRLSPSDDDLDERRRKFLERNRAAAARCRNKKKVWMSSLEQRADDMYTVNTVLQAEVVKLRQELAQLKAMLSAHQDCPIAVQQRTCLAGSINVSSAAEACSDEAIAMAALSSMAGTVAADGSTKQQLVQIAVDLSHTNVAVLNAVQHF